MTMPHPASPLAARNRPLLAAEARFGAWAERLVGRVIARAEGGDPVAMRLCMARAVPVGRRPPLALGPVEDRAGARRAIGEITAALGAGRINIRQTAACLAALGEQGRNLPGLAAVRAAAQVEADLAQATGAMGMDHFFTVPPAAPGAPAADSFVEHDLIRKPVPTFRDHAPTNQTKEPTP
jgi:hypothetical protein